MSEPSREDLRDAIGKTHGCEARWVATAPVVERHEGRTVWEGTVEVFDLIGHATATRAYAWSHETDSGGRRFFAVLHAPPIDSPAAAVRAAIVHEHRRS